MNIKVKRLHKDAKLPIKAHIEDAGWDLFALTKTWNNLHKYYEYGTGIALSIPENYVGLLFPRSSISNYDLFLCNSVGVIDAKFHGEIKLRFKENYINSHYTYNIGDKIGQLMIISLGEISLIEVADLGDSDRGIGGFGSSGI